MKQEEYQHIINIILIQQAMSTIMLVKLNQVEIIKHTQIERLKKATPKYKNIFQPVKIIKNY